MALKVYDTIDEVPEALREAAIPTKDDKFVAEDDSVLEKTLEKERLRVAEVEKLQRNAEQERDRLKAERDARERGASEDEIQRRRKELETATKPLQDTIDKQAARLKQVLHIDKVRGMALAAGILADRIEDAMLILEKRTDLTSDEKGLLVKDKDGNVLATKVEDFLSRDFKQEKPWLYAGTGTSGSGTRPSNAPAPTAAERAARVNDERSAEKRAIVSGAF